MKTVCHEISKEDYISWQHKMAENVIIELVGLEPELEDLLYPELLLDALGCAGLSLHIGDESSLAYIEGLKASLE